MLLCFTVSISRQTAEALPALERAYVFIEIDSEFSRHIESILDRADQNADIDYQFVNHGKTPAVIRAMSADFHHWTDFPKKIRYIDEPLSGEIVVPAGEIYPEPINRVATTLQSRMATTAGYAPPTKIYFQKQKSLNEPLDAEAIRSIQEGISFLWFYGHVVYNDVFEKPHETRFCWVYNGRAKSFHQYNRGDEGLNHRT